MKEDERRKDERIERECDDDEREGGKEIERHGQKSGVQLTQL